MNSGTGVSPVRTERTGREETHGRDARATIKIPLALFLIVTIVVTVMANNIQFSIAIHIMAALACGC